MQGVLAYGVHKDICRSMDEYPQLVCLERVAGHPVAFHSLLELPYEQLVSTTSAVVLLIKVLFHHGLNVGHYESDVEHPFSVYSALTTTRCGSTHVPAL